MEFTDTIEFILNDEITEQTLRDFERIYHVIKPEQRLTIRVKQAYGGDFTIAKIIKLKLILLIRNGYDVQAIIEENGYAYSSAFYILTALKGCNIFASQNSQVAFHLLSNKESGEYLDFMDPDCLELISEISRLLTISQTDLMGKFHDKKITCKSIIEKNIFKDISQYKKALI